MKRYYVSADGGGSKMSVILFDEDYNLCGYGRSGAINPRFVSNQIIRENFQQSVDQCFRHVQIDSVEILYIAMPGPMDLFAYLLSKRVKLKQYRKMSEGEMSLLAGVFSEQGIVALSGTGSGVFFVNGQQSSNLGGWGALFDDEGSGYSIGQAALSAAVKSFEKRAAFTLLQELIVREWKLLSLRQVIECVYESKDYRGLIASLVITVIEAAKMNDLVSQKILQQAGIDMARQVIALIQRESIPLDQKVMIAGSVWKDNAYMYDAFQARLSLHYPQLTISIPAFEAVLGGVIKTVLTEQGSANEQIIRLIHENYTGFIYNLDILNRDRQV